MLILHDRASMAHVLTLALDPKLHALLKQRIDALQTAHGDLTTWTEFIIVQSGDTEADIVREVGFSPLADPINGARFNSSGFNPCWDYLVDHGGWFELIVTFGSTFAYVLLIEDAKGVPLDLLAMCRRYAGEAA